MVKQGTSIMENDKKIFWGWYVVAGSFFVLAVNYGARYCFGVFLKPLSLEHGWSRSVISLAATLNMIFYSTGAIFLGRMLDRISPRWIITAGALLAAAGYFLTSRISTPLGFYIGYGLCVGTGASCLGVVVCSSSVGKWFLKKRGIALGISTMGISFGAVALTPLAGYINQTLGWRAGLTVLGVVTCFFGIWASQLLMRKNRPEDDGLLPDGDRVSLTGRPPAPPAVIRVPLSVILQDRRFWTIAAGQGLAVMALMSVFVHQAAFAMDNGIGSLGAASSLAMISMTGFVGQFFFGWLSDRVRDPKYAYITGISVMLIGAILLRQVHTATMLYLSALVFGFGYGCLAPVLPILVSDRFGRHVLGSIYGLLTFFIGIGGSIGPLLGGMVHDTFDSYQHLWEINIVFLAFVSVLMFTLKKGKHFG
jgi:MFS transporter, OFA family, oxalate/formate antiporter